MILTSRGPSAGLFNSAIAIFFLAFRRSLRRCFWERAGR